MLARPAAARRSDLDRAARAPRSQGARYEGQTRISSAERRRRTASSPLAWFCRAPGRTCVCVPVSRHVPTSQVGSPSSPRRHSPEPRPFRDSGRHGPPREAAALRGRRRRPRRRASFRIAATRPECIERLRRCGEGAGRSPSLSRQAPRRGTDASSSGPSRPSHSAPGRIGFHVWRRGAASCRKPPCRLPNVPPIQARQPVQPAGAPSPSRSRHSALCSSSGCSSRPQASVPRRRPRARPRLRLRFPLETALSRRKRGSCPRRRSSIR